MTSDSFIGDLRGNGGNSGCEAGWHVFEILFESECVMETVAGYSFSEFLFNIDFIMRWSSNDQRFNHSKQFAHSVDQLYSLDRSASFNERSFKDNVRHDESCGGNPLFLTTHFEIVVQGSSTSCILIIFLIIEMSMFIFANEHHASTIFFNFNLLLQSLYMQNIKSQNKVLIINKMSYLIVDEEKLLFHCPLLCI